MHPVLLQLKPPSPAAGDDNSRGVPLWYTCKGNVTYSPPAALSFALITGLLGIDWSNNGLLDALHPQHQHLTHQPFHMIRYNMKHLRYITYIKYLLDACGLELCIDRVLDNATSITSAGGGHNRVAVVLRGQGS
jgi:hypothetical protein